MYHMTRIPEPTLRLKLDRLPGESGRTHKTRNEIFRDTIKGKIPPVHAGETTISIREKHLAAAQLKERCRSVVFAIADATPAALPATIECLRGVEWCVRMFLKHGLVEAHENEFSGRQLLHPQSLMDWLAAMESTKQQHRPPAYVERHHELAESINRKLDVLAAGLCRTPELRAAWQEANEGSEVTP